MIDILKQFKTLKLEKYDFNLGYNIVQLGKNHKIGVTENGYPIFFIKCKNQIEQGLLDYTLELISVQFNKNCILYSNKKKLPDEIFTVISIKIDNTDLQEYFLNVFYMVIKKLPSLPKTNELKFEIDNIIKLFSKFSKPPQKTIQGLWSELLVIEQSRRPKYLINAWHKNSKDKFDFNDGIDKIEVKSTSMSRRIHKFSIEQLNPNSNSNLIIVSIFSIETNKGKSIFDLIKHIANRINDYDVLKRVNDVIFDTLGSDYEKSFEVYFDYQLAIDSIQYFDSKLIPKIANENIRSEISNVHFDSDLTNIPFISSKAIKSILHQSLIKY